ncbi:alpha/beta hydrolase [Mangrovimonas yunxiaonensis]|uniref:Alpha/beta hydrolase n=1 Tax=Mangrovimonas yunxiaonensis TaxID=1197477 RepID=A0A084THF1_9FLAO|nr:alpha/beta hydrolase [Mangrovimonas yunxiaonensis]KFB00137.1 alpha/beta hydrolase [Mangrovimonas yunxiaonensis]GGH42094.1 putative carboxylesterase nap [Mangrovimonas yunxiaonensis]
MKKYFSIVILLLSCNVNEFPDSYYKTPEYLTTSSLAYKQYYKAYNESLALWDVDFEELYIPTSHGMAHVTKSGRNSGTPLVLLHGMEASSTMWYPNIKALSKDHCVFTIDLITEPGKSKKTKDFDSVDELIQWYNDIFNKLHLKQVNVIGASRGGWLATKLAVENPDRINTLILLSPAQTFVWIPPSQDLLTNIFNAFSSERKKVYRTLETMTVNMNNISKTYLDQYVLGKKLEIENQFVAAMQPFSKKELAKLNMPVYILIGDNDLINNNRSLSYANEAITTVKGEVLPNSGHFISIDQAEAVNNKILTFLKKH